MAVYGDLTTMPFPELLQWLGSHGKTGRLEVERDKICKRLTFEAGRVVATASGDPREKLGHFLVSRGQITEDLLRIALGQQESTGKPLGVTLVEMGVLTTEEVIRNLSAQAEETIFSLFEWDGAVFRFEQADSPGASLFPIDIRVNDILLRGMQRLDEIQRIRTVFDDPGIVPERTDKLPPPEVFRNKMARRIYEAIDGERTVADILLHAHGSEYVVTKFLYELHRTGLLSIRTIRERAAPRDAVGARAPTPSAVAEPPSPTAASGSGPAEPDPPVRDAAVVAAAAPPSPATYRAPWEQDLETARTLMARGEFDAALDVLDRLYRDRPNNEALRRLTQEAEAAFIDKAWKHYLPASKIAVVTRPLESLEAEDLTPQEFFLLSRIDGTWDLKSIIQIAPIREIEALRTLKRMRDQGVIELRDPEV